MNGDNDEQSQHPVGRGSKSVNIVDDSAFDVKKIKRERNDVCGDNGGPSDSGGGGGGGGGGVEVGGGSGNNIAHHQQTRIIGSNNGPRVSNGFHGEDLLQGVLSAKITALAHGPAAKHDKIRIMIEDAISEDSKCRVQEIFLQVDQLRIEEKLLLYLKLPVSLSSPGGTVDPLRQPLNPLGNRYEIHQTIMWIKTHLEEDPDVSLPKQEVYDEYNMFCVRNAMKPLSTADFGKVMKQVYPRVRPRRLGTRGNSRYCYAGMRKRVKLDPPTLPAITSTQSGDEGDDATEEMLGAASTLIREWAENLLGSKFPTLNALARHLVNNLCVDTRSMAAVCILYAAGDPQPSQPGQPQDNKEVTSDSPAVVPVSGKPAKLREAQLQLQRKLQQREHIRDQKHRHFDAVSQNENKEKTVDNNKGGGSKGGKKSKTSQSPQGTNTSIAGPTGRHKKSLKSGNNNITSMESNCDNIVVQSVEETQCSSDTRVAKVVGAGTSSLKDVKTKNPRKRANFSMPIQPPESSPEKQAKLLDSQATMGNMGLPKLTSTEQQPDKISLVVSNSLKPANSKCKTTHANSGCNQPPAKNCDMNKHEDNGYAKLNGCQNSSLSLPDTNNLMNSINPMNVQVTTSAQSLQENTKLLDRTDKLCTIDSDALDDYLNGGNNSQEQEEELLQYFQQSSSSSSDAEPNNMPIDTERISRSDKVSQLRLILQQNLKAGTIHPPPEPAAILVPNLRQSLPIDKPETAPKGNLILPTLLNHPSQASTRRRVSFETNVVEHFQEHNSLVSTNMSMNTHANTNTIPQSPNTRRRIFNFTPISPGPHSPINGRASKPSSANASPFVSPRNTPVPRSRSNVQANGPRSRTSQKTLSRSMSCSTPYTNRQNDTFVVPTSGPELTRQMSAPQSPLAYTKPSDIQPIQASSSQAKLDQIQEAQSSNFLPTDLAPQKQLFINYPSQENLQEIKNVYQKNLPADQEISELFHDDKQFTNEQLYYRSQSVPLHRMVVNPTLMSPLASHPYPTTTAYQSQSFNPSTSSSIAPTPVPSEFNDFGPIGQLDGNTYLLNDADPSFIADSDNFLIGDKEITPENLSNILNILDVQDSQSLQILPVNTGGDPLLLDANGLPNSGLNLPVADIMDTTVQAVLDSSVNGTLQRIIHSRSYPNTPLPPALSYTSPYTEDSNGSRSYPSTPVQPMQTREIYPETSEPMLSSPTLNSLNLHSDTVNANANTNVDVPSTNVCRNVADLLETSFLGDADDEADDLDPLGNFDGLQDVDSLTPLFNEVSEPNC